MRIGHHEDDVAAYIWDRKPLWRYVNEADPYNKTPLITINSWNEWTETSYLEPDTLNGYGYLEAVKKVFK